jgi:WXXGXW repeat (2 copies)
MSEYFTAQQRLLFQLQLLLHLNMKMKYSTVALAALLFVGLSLTSSFAQIGISIGIAPPPIPIYEQPYPPVAGYIWTPGYWAYDSDYYWVPGVWVPPPRVGFLWTPGYWAFDGSNYFFNEGYWGPTVGFYGGINYGWGYGGVGYFGGEWVGNTFRYNTAVTRVNTAVIHNTYVNKKVVTNTGSRASFNGPGGTTAKPTAQEQAAAKAEHLPPTAAQQSRVEAAKKDPALHAANNHGKPKAEAIKALDRNNEAQAGAGKAKGKQETANGNSAFGHKQGNVTTRTKGSQNNAHGKAESAEVHASHTAKTATAHHTVQHPQMVSHRPQGMPTREVGPGASSHTKGRTAQPTKKKKPSNEEQGGGH